MDVKKAMVGGAPWATYAETSGNDVTLYPLASSDPTGTAGAFADLRKAISEAQDFIFIADWSFQPYVRLVSGGTPSMDETVGAILQKRAEAGVLVAVHAWDHTNMAAGDTQNDNGGDRLDDIAKALNKAAKGRHANFLWRASSRTGIGWSHHQKFVVMDAPGAGGRRTLRAFFGGLDLTKGRFDWGEHRIMPMLGVSDGLQVPLRDPNTHMEYDDWYSAEFTRSSVKPKDAAHPGRDDVAGDTTMPRQPWQDFYAQIVGPSAWDIVREFTGRWLRDPSIGSTPGDNAYKAMKTVEDKFTSLFDKAKYVQPWEKGSGPFNARVLRSLESAHWGPMPTAFGTPKVEVDGEKGKQEELHWILRGSFERSIQDAYLRSIKQADRFIYIETQYLISSGASWSKPRKSVTNQVAKAVADRIVEKIKNDEEFHAYLVIPMFPEGNPVDSTIQTQRHFEWLTMEMMATIVTKALQEKGSSKEWNDYVSFYFLANWDNGTVVTPIGRRGVRVQTNARYQIYVHSKLMIVDDEFLILGSANLNERSLAGDRDSEICLYLSAGDGQLAACKQKIQDLRKTTWQQHFGALPNGWDEPQKAACVTDVRQRAAEGYKMLRERRRSDGRHIVSIPMSMKGGNFHTETVSRYALEDPYLVDAEALNKLGGSGPEWLWPSKDAMHAMTSMAE